MTGLRNLKRIAQLSCFRTSPQFHLAMDREPRFVTSVVCLKFDVFENLTSFDFDEP